MGNRSRSRHFDQLFPCHRFLSNVRSGDLSERRKEPLACLVPSAHAFAGLKSIKLKALAEHHSSPSPANPPRHSRITCGSYAGAAGFRPRIILESPRAQAVAPMVAAGSGVAILPETLGVMMGCGLERSANRRTSEDHPRLCTPDESGGRGVAEFDPVIEVMRENSFQELFCCTKPSNDEISQELFACAQIVADHHMIEHVLRNHKSIISIFRILKSISPKKSNN